MPGPLGRLTLAFVVMLFGALGGACTVNEVDGEDEDLTQSVELEAYDFYFKQTSMQVGLGADINVAFTNNGEVTHAFVVPDLDLEIEAKSAEATEFTFQAPDEPGLLDFYCKYHPDDMNGTISIGGADVPLEEQQQGDEDD